MSDNLDPAALGRFVSECNGQLSARRRLSVEGTDVLLVGRAFDYAFRWHFDDFQPRAAELGATLCQRAAQILDKPEWKESLDVISKLVEVGNIASKRTTRWRVCCVFSWFEEIYRTLAIPDPLEDCWGKPVTRETIAALLGAVPLESVQDIDLLMGHVTEDWGDVLQEKEHILNPTFAGSRDVSGADADWIIGSTLWDCKVSRQRRPFREDYIQQALGYVLLDYDDTYRIEEVGWYFPRQRLLLHYGLSMIIHKVCIVSGDSAEALTQLRTSFRGAVSKK